MNKPDYIQQATLQDQPAISTELLDGFERQRQVLLNEDYPSYRQRKKDLQQLAKMLDENQEAIIEAINQDYGNRSRHETIFAEFIATFDSIKSTIKNLKKWMSVQNRKVDFMMFPGVKNKVIPQPLGVVGIIVPWNFPVFLSFSPLCAAFAAGNSAMVKMSENSIQLSRLLKRVVGDYFPPEKLMFYEEKGGVGVEFSQLPFNLLIFTGSGQTGRAVMASAAKNLTPVLLELGGKSPAVIAPDYPMQKAVDRIMYIKQLNAGQICVNVDYVFVHEDQQADFIAKAKSYVAAHCPDITSKDYTSIIDDKSFARLIETLEDAKAKGATVINLSDTQQPDAKNRKFPIHIVSDTTDTMLIRQREIFGPILMVMTYKEHDEVINYINQQDSPLAFYPFTNDKKLADKYITRVMSGGVTVNDVLLHVAQHDMPFGGVNQSGMGQYHSYEGFLSCSKLRPVCYQASFSAIKYLAPPYGKFADRMFNTMLKLKKS